MIITEILLTEYIEEMVIILKDFLETVYKKLTAKNVKNGLSLLLKKTDEIFYNFIIGYFKNFLKAYSSLIHHQKLLITNENCNHFNKIKKQDLSLLIKIGKMSDNLMLTIN